MTCVDYYHQLLFFFVDESAVFWSFWGERGTFFYEARISLHS